MRPNYDIHIHTTFSDGAHSVEEQVRFGYVCGLDVMAISDHFFPGAGIAAGEKRFGEYLDAINAAAAQVAIPVLKAVEGTVLNLRGEVSVTPEAASQLDLVLVDFSGYSDGVLRNTPSDKKQLAANALEALINVCENPTVNIIAHPFNLGRTQPWLRPSEIPREDLHRAAEAFVRNDKVFEIMNCMFWWFPQMPIDEFHEEYTTLVRLFAEHGVRFSVGSDDHRTGVGNLAWSQRVIRELAIPDEQMIDPREVAEHT